MPMWGDGSMTVTFKRSGREIAKSAAFFAVTQYAIDKVRDYRDETRRVVSEEKPVEEMVDDTLPKTIDEIRTEDLDFIFTYEGVQKIQQALNTLLGYTVSGEVLLDFEYQKELEILLGVVNWMISGEGLEHALKVNKIWKENL